jgi:hypothetical protein
MPMQDARNENVKLDDLAKQELTDVEPILEADQKEDRYRLEKKRRNGELTTAEYEWEIIKLVRAVKNNILQRGAILQKYGQIPVKLDATIMKPNWWDDSEGGDDKWKTLKTQHSTTVYKILRDQQKERTRNQRPAQKPAQKQVQKQHPKASQRRPTNRPFQSLRDSSRRES